MVLGCILLTIRSTLYPLEKPLEDVFAYGFVPPINIISISLIEIMLIFRYGSRGNILPLGTGRYARDNKREVFS
jgi:hypothetical protein